jgi:hypothetical protein
MAGLILLYLLGYGPASRLAQPANSGAAPAWARAVTYIYRPLAAHPLPAAYNRYLAIWSPSPSHPADWTLSTQDKSSFVATHTADVDTITRLASDPTPFHDQIGDPHSPLTDQFRRDGILQAYAPLRGKEYYPIGGYGTDFTGYATFVNPHSWVPIKWKNMDIQATTAWAYLGDTHQWQRIVVLTGTTQTPTHRPAPWQLEINVPTPQ